MISSRVSTLDIERVPAPFVSSRPLSTQEGPKAILVAPVEHRQALLDALRAASQLDLRCAANYRDLWLIPGMKHLQLAVFSDVLPSFELEAACRLIRRRSPQARILLLASRPNAIGAALYDERVAASMAPQQLKTAIQRLLGKGSRED